MAERWERAAARLGRDDRGPAARLTGLMKTHSSAAFFGCDTVLEAAIFSSLIEAGRDTEDDRHVDP